MADQNDYFISVARNFRNRLPENWVERISAIEGVEIVNSTPLQARIKANRIALERIRQDFKDALLIETIIGRSPL